MDLAVRATAYQAIQFLQILDEITSGVKTRRIPSALAETEIRRTGCSPTTTRMATRGIRMQTMVLAGFLFCSAAVEGDVVVTTIKTIAILVIPVPVAEPVTRSKY